MGLIRRWHPFMRAGEDAADLRSATREYAEEGRVACLHRRARRFGLKLTALADGTFALDDRETGVRIDRLSPGPQRSLTLVEAEGALEEMERLESALDAPLPDEP